MVIGTAAKGMVMDFIGEVIKVETAGEVKRPAKFTWQGHEYTVARILANWHDYSMPHNLRYPKWFMRHHRNYYHVETDTGDRFEIYFDRGQKRPDWVLLRQLSAAADRSPGPSPLPLPIDSTPHDEG
jgi:hypothetical protein